MDPTERALLHETVRDALTARPDDADAVLAELGWDEMLAAEPDDAIAAVFGALGTTNASASVLDDVVGTGMGFVANPDCAVLLPSFG